MSQDSEKFGTPPDIRPNASSSGSGAESQQPKIEAISGTVEWPKGGRSLGQAPGADAKETLASEAPALSGAEPSIVARTSYVIGEEVARGGRGRIIKAQDRRLGRPVAIKEMLDRESESAARFLREALITANLQHPAIVPVYEAGYWTSGAPFYAMKMVSGDSLQDVIGRTRSLNERLALLPNMIAVAEAIAYAHSQGIVHRDLKPANVLVGSFGETVVVDWGLAKKLAEPDCPETHSASTVIGSSELTLAGTVMGTPAYMAPEQARGLTADTRVDVYALGAMLYHLLAGDSPYPGHTGLQVLERINKGSPPRPVELVQPQVPRDLAAIVRKAMSTDSADRYPTANELAADLKRFQTGQLVSAHVYSMWSLIARWIGRHRATVAVAAVLLLALAGTAGVSVQRIIRERNRAERQRAQAQVARQQAETRTNELILMEARDSLERDPTATVAWLKTFPTTVPGWGAVRVIAADALQRGIARRVLHGHQSNVNAALFLPGNRVASASFDKTVRVWTLATNDVRVLTGHRDIIVDLATSPDGKTLASTGQDRTVRLWDVDSGRSRVLTGHQGPIRRVIFSADGRRLASASNDGTARVWDVTSTESRVFQGDPGTVWTVAFSPDGQFLLTGGPATVRRWDLRTGAGKVVAKHGAAVNGAVFSPDGRTIASCSDDRTVQVCDQQSGKCTVIHGHTGSVNAVVFAPSGKTFASASDDGTVRLWSLDGRLIKAFVGHRGPVRTIDIARDGRNLASAGADGAVRLWDIASGAVRVLRGHTSEVASVKFSADGKTLLSASWDDTVRLWEIGEDAHPVVHSQGAVKQVVFSPDGAHAAWAAADSIDLFDLRSNEVRQLGVAPNDLAGAPLSSRVPPPLAGPPAQAPPPSHLGTAPLRGHRSTVNRLAFSPQGGWLASAYSDGRLRLWETSTGEARALARQTQAVNSVAFAPDGETLASVGADRTVRLWNVSTGSGQILGSHDANVEQVAFSSDGQWVGSGADDGSVRIWNVLTRQVQVVGTTSYRIRHVAFSPSGRWFAWASDVVHLRDPTGATERSLSGHGSYVMDLVFVSDDELVSGSRDKRLIDWDLRSGSSKVLRGHQSQVTSLSLAFDGKRLASASWDGTVRLWDLETGESRVLRGHEGRLNFVSYSPDGQLVASAGDDGTVRFWRDDLPTDTHKLRAWMDSATDATVEARGTDRLDVAGSSPIIGP